MPKAAGGDLPFPFGGDNFWPWQQLTAAILTLATKPADENEVTTVYQRMLALTANSLTEEKQDQQHGGDSINNG